MTAPATTAPRTTRGRLAVVLLAFLAGATALLAVPSTHGALTGRVNNTGNTVASSVYGSGTCTQVVNSAPKAQNAYPLAEGSGTTAANAVTGPGTTNGTYTSSGITYGVAGPCVRDAGKAVTLDGSSGFVRGPSANNPQVFSVQVWFRTTTRSGGKLVGFGNNTGTSGASTDYDRHVFMRDDGNLVFGVFPNGTFGTVRTTTPLNDGQWHQVVGTLTGANGASKGLRLYVDGALVASDTSITGAQVFNGAWRFGYDNLDNWGADMPSSDFFAGSISWGAVWTSALTAAQVKNLYTAGR